MEEAVKKVEKMDADLGGTEILQPLEHIYSQPCVPKQPRQVNNNTIWSNIMHNHGEKVLTFSYLRIKYFKIKK